jgi:hypothetical protein
MNVKSELCETIQEMLLLYSYPRVVKSCRLQRAGPVVRTEETKVMHKNSGTETRGKATTSKTDWWEKMETHYQFPSFALEVSNMLVVITKSN